MIFLGCVYGLSVGISEEGNMEVSDETVEGEPKDTLSVLKHCRILKGSGSQVSL